MSLTKLLKAPIKLFRKEVITFVIIRRYDLGVLDERLRYIAVKPTASISVLRQKVWHLLDLPDFCEEIIVLKSKQDVVQLGELRKGNDPQHPYILEVWSPGYRLKIAASTAVHNNMLTIGNGEDDSQYANQINTTEAIYENIRPDTKDEKLGGLTCFSQSTVTHETTAMNNLRIPDNKMAGQHSLLSGFRKSDMSCRISSTCMFRLGGKKSRDNFSNILLQIQGDLSALSNKLSVLEKKLPL